METIADIKCKKCGRKLKEHNAIETREEFDPVHNPFDE